MKKQIPYNNVSWDYKGSINTFVSELNEAEQNNVVSVFLTGSYARGEAAENSDLDIWCVFKQLNSGILSKVGLISQKLSVVCRQTELNPQCLTLDEFNSSCFSKFLTYPIIYFEAVLLFGENIAVRAIRKEEADKIYKEFLAEVLLSIRHYITVNESEEKLTFQKIKTWVLKPLMFALRLERYSFTNQYPLTIKDLLNAYTEPPLSVIYFTNSDKWDKDIKDSKDRVLHALHDEVEKLLLKEQS
ncbi:MAG: nucleotidyltransferase domain-containing protein [Oscillospiraceae bacterium]|nr:nucleotidyltransferase domain-containing protein [Oscillospiraceae bacterium]